MSRLNNKRRKKEDRQKKRKSIENAFLIEDEKPVRAVSYDRNQAKITLRGVPDRPGIASAIFTPLGENGISVDMIVQNVSEEGLTDLTFTVKRQDLKRTIEIVKGVAKELGFKDVLYDSKIAKVSIIGTGMIDRPGIAGKMFSALAKAGINIQMISTSEIKISCVIDEKYLELAVRELHDAFELGK